MLSNTVAKALEMSGGSRAEETARFVTMFDRFFDCLNVRSFTAGRHSRNSFKSPYWSSKDFRLTVSTLIILCTLSILYLIFVFQWLKTQFLQYLDDWQKSVEQRPGDYSAGARKKMQLSEETLTGLRITGVVYACLPFT